MRNPLRVLLEKLSLRRAVSAVFKYDKRRFLDFAGALHAVSKDARRAEIVMEYHVLEKGLTMPQRHLAFGRWTVWHLIDLLGAWRTKEGDFSDGQVKTAVQVLLAYEKLHRDMQYDETKDAEFWQKLHFFTATVQGLFSPMQEPHLKRETLVAARDASFPQFAASRRSVRNFTGEPISVSTLKEAVALAMTAPSACNRQHTRVHAVTSPQLKRELLQLQQGCRGFGDKAGAFLVITACLGCVRWPEERNDLYTNAGLFLMNLSYALHWHGVAHCILNWSAEPSRDRKLRQCLSLPEEEEIVAVVACGCAPEEFDVASSPRRSVDEIFTEHQEGG